MKAFRTEPKEIFFGALNLVQGAAVGAIVLLIEGGASWVDWLLGSVSIGMLLAGPMLVFAGHWGRRFAAAICLVHLALGALLAACVVSSAAYLLGIYGSHGQNAGSLALILAALVLAVFWLIPAHELFYLRRKEGAR